MKESLKSTCFALKLLVGKDIAQGLPSGPIFVENIKLKERSDCMLDLNRFIILS
jgi:hypothetical protein